ASFPSVEAAADAVLAITREMRPAMLEFMDHASINAVEDAVRMGLDRNARALLLAQSDAPGAAGAQEIATIVAACEKHGATEVFATDDAAEGEAFTAARRSMFPRCRRWAACCSRTSACPCSNCPHSLRRRGDCGGLRRPDLHCRPRRRRQHPPADCLRPHRPRHDRPRAASRSVASWISQSRLAAPSPGARRRTAQAGLAARAARRGRHGAEPTSQDRTRSAGDPQSGCRAALKAVTAAPRTTSAAPAQD
ncbi:hypothetical protein GS451_10470, partial [Rhodococcus hoagii]|nr:hypothetical protein [Prescottella equi]